VVSELGALLLSAAVEGPVAFALAALSGWPSRGPVHVAAAAMLATAATHPRLWEGALWLYPRIGYAPGVAAAEGVVILVEAAVIAWAAGMSAGRALVVSTVANGASAGLGLLLA
jgi:hypothetical protein